MERTHKTVRTSHGPAQVVTRAEMMEIAEVAEWWMMEPVDMGFLKDDVTRYYLFREGDDLYIVYKY